jgi:MFS family permease
MSRRAAPWPPLSARWGTSACSAVRALRLRLRSAPHSILTHPLSLPADLQAASIAVPFMVSFQDQVVPKVAPKGMSPDFPEPTWAGDALKGSVFVGAFIGMIGLGYLGDLLGRRTGMLMTLSIVVISALGTAITPWLSIEYVYPVLTFARFMLGVGVGGIYPMAAATAGEAKKSTVQAGKIDEASATRAAWAFFFQSWGSRAQLWR